MVKLIFEFYIPAFLITTMLVAVWSVIYLLFFLTDKKKKFTGSRRQQFFDVFIIALLIIPVASFAVLAITVVLRSL